MTVVSYPIPLYSNVPIRAEYYQPRRSVIGAITLGQITRVTLTAPYTFWLGQTVRFIIPEGYGTRQLNGQQGLIVALVSDTEVDVKIDSQGMDAFIAASLPNQPQLLPIGDQNSGAINRNGQMMQQTYIDGSFINVSPNG